MRRRSPLYVMGRLVVLVKPLLPVMAATVVLGILGYLAAIGITVLGGFALLNGAGIETSYSLVPLIIGIAACALLRGVLRYGEQLSGHYIAFKLLAVIRDKVFSALRRLAPAKLEGKDKGNLISVITSDIELLEVFYAHTIAPVLIGFFTSLIMTAFIWQYHPALGITAAAAYVTVAVLIPLAVSPVAKRQGAVNRERVGALSGYFLDSLRGIAECIQYSCGSERMDRINRMTDEVDASQRFIKRHEGVSKALTEAAVLGFSFGILLLGLRLRQQGQVGYEGVFIPFVAMISSFGPVVALSSLSTTLLQTVASGERVLDILDEAPQVEEVENGLEVSFVGAECRQVSFSYKGEPALEEVSLKLPPNRIIGIAGRSGSGKSTLLKLLMRFWDTNKGDIQVSGKSIRDLNTGCLRRIESYMTQDTFLLNDTIEANIRLGCPDATREQVEVAARQASIHSFIESLDKGYDTSVGDLGERLSAGERQRIGLARAFLHDAPLLLLDEPTSNLDGLNEAIILKSLKQQSKGKTIVLVSHRRSSLGIADKVYQMESRRLS